MALTIGQVAARAGVNSETVRYYERRKLLPVPERTVAGYRQYSADVVARSWPRPAGPAGPRPNAPFSRRFRMTAPTFDLAVLELEKKLGEMAGRPVKAYRCGCR
jgi:hypothetical protein